MGPNVKKLIAHKMSLEMVPSGSGFMGAIEAIREPGRIGREAKAATDWVQMAITAVRSAPDNLFGDDDELIAGEILRRLNDPQRSSSGGNQVLPKK